MIKHSNLRFLKVERGRVKVLMPLEGNKNHLGTMYAGAIFTAGESIVGSLLMSAFNMTDFFPTLAESTIKYLKPVTTDVTVDIRMTEEELERVGSEAKSIGKSNFELISEIKNDQDEICAVLTGNY